MLGRLVQKAVLNVFNRSFGGAELAEVVKGFEGGVAVQTADSMPSDGVRQAGGPDAGAAGGRRQARRHRAGRAWPRRWSSCWRGCTSPRSSTRTSRRAATATGLSRCRSTDTRAGTARRRSTSTPTTCWRRWPTTCCYDGDPWRALRRLMQQGARKPEGRRMPGLKDLLEQLRRQKQERMHRYDLGSSLEDIKKKLEEVMQDRARGHQAAHAGGPGAHRRASRSWTPSRPIRPAAARAAEVRLRRSRGQAASSRSC